MKLEPPPAPLARWQHCTFNKHRDSRHHASLTRDTNQCVCDITTYDSVSLLCRLTMSSGLFLPTLNSRTGCHANSLQLHFWLTTCVRAVIAAKSRFSQDPSKVVASGCFLFSRHNFQRVKPCMQNDRKYLWFPQLRGMQYTMQPNWPSAARFIWPSTHLELENQNKPQEDKRLSVIFRSSWALCGRNHKRSTMQDLFSKVQL